MTHVYPRNKQVQPRARHVVFASRLIHYNSEKMLPQYIFFALLSLEYISAACPGARQTYVTPTSFPGISP